MPEIQKVKSGCQVEVELLSRSSESERLSFTLVEDDKADFEAGFLGLSTPLAKTILGKFAGQTLPYSAGDLKSVKIISVQASGQMQTEDVAARRQATLDQAVKHSDYVNAMIFAGAVNSKWGDYDIDKLDPAQWEPGKKDQPEK
jgi:hypothetical protein